MGNKLNHMFMKRLWVMMKIMLERHERKKIGDQIRHTTPVWYTQTNKGTLEIVTPLSESHLLHDQRM